jgi:RluA family pseudouridine synthase
LEARDQIIWSLFLWFNTPMLDIIHQDNHLLILNKSSGIAVQPEGWDPGAPYLVKSLEERYEKIWVVHRLDKVTSGVMVFARTAEAHRSLNTQFERHTVEKVYLAMTEGLPPWNEHTARHMLQPNVGRAHRTVVVRKRGKKSETHLKVLQRGPTHALLEAQPRTGRTHQVRAHLTALGYPLVGDSLYGAAETELITRPALHALSLKFSHPGSGQQVLFRAPLPDDFKAALDKAGLD